MKKGAVSHPQLLNADWYMNAAGPLTTESIEFDGDDGDARTVQTPIDVPYMEVGDAVVVCRDGNQSIRALVRHVDEARRLYGKPVWVTEIATESEETTRSLLAHLDSLEYVERYCWAEGPLIASDGSLTGIGEIYAAWPQQPPLNPEA
jgi:hypothetical protein